MRSNDVRDELADGFEPHPGPPPQEPVRVGTPPRPRLCEAGPCENYHRFEIQTEAEDPRARKVAIRLPIAPGVHPTADGALYQAPAAFHTQTHHYCYPTPGVEMNLGSLPVVQCNRWRPKGMPPGAFMSTLEGRQYLKSVEEWEADRQRSSQEAAEIERLIEESLSPPSPPQGETP